MLADLLAFINEHHGAVFAPGERFPTGEQGAFAITDGTGEGAGRFVLKYQQGIGVPDGVREAVAVTERLRAVGYPAPRYRLVGFAPSLGVCYSVQEALPGAPLGRRLDEAILDQLLELNELQRWRAGAEPRDWPGRVVDTVLYGGEGFCLLEPLRTHSTATAELLAVLQQLVASHRGERSPADDIVHFDFQGANILVDQGQISGVVDWEGACAGDCAFDLATLFFYADDEDGADPDQRERLWRLLLARTMPALRRIYLAHLILRQVDWSIRFHDRAAVGWYLRRAREVLRQLSTEV